MSTKDKARVLVLLGLGMALIANSGLGQSSGETMIGVVGAGGAAAYALCDNGDWYQKNDSIHEHIWTYEGNVFAYTGQPPDATQFVAVTSCGESNWGLYAFCKNGDWYQKNATATKDHEWTFHGNIFEEAGHGQPGVTSIICIASYGAQDNGVYMLCDNGEWYVKNITASKNHVWTYEGNIFELAGVVPAKSDSWGSLKAKSR
jgi:hypothetical protein